MKSYKAFYFSAVSNLNIDWLKKNSPSTILIPFQHIVSDKEVPYIQPLYQFKTTQQFETDLDYLLKHFEAVTLLDVIHHQKNKIPFKKTSFLLTFDDGLRQVYDVVAPLLLRKGVPAALFLNPAFIDNKVLFHDLKKGLILHHLDSHPIHTEILQKASEISGSKIHTLQQLKKAVRSINYLTRSRADEMAALLNIDFDEFRKKERPFMTAEQISELVRKGFEVGAHSVDHPLFSLISVEEQIRQTIESLNLVCQQFDIAYRAFAFPYLDTGVGRAFFNQISNHNHPPDLMFGNRTGMSENFPGVLHRYIGENPSISAATMAKAVLAFSLVRKKMNAKYIHRT